MFVSYRRYRIGNMEGGNARRRPPYDHEAGLVLEA